MKNEFCKFEAEYPEFEDVFQSLEQQVWTIFEAKCHFYFTDATSKTTIIVKFKGAIDIVITPVVLESAQRMFDSLTPTFQRLHPNSVVNHLHSQSLDRVESKNTLMKKEKSLDLQEKFLDTSGKDLQVKPLKWLLEPLCCTVLHEVL